MRIALKNWQPDLDGLTNNGQADIKNVYPLGSGGYGPFGSLTATYSGTLDGTALGAISAQDNSGVTQTVAGTTDKLYKLNLTAGTFGDVSKSGGYHVSTAERWVMTQYGSRIIATNISDPPQYFDMSSSSVFADLGGSPPQARNVAVIRDFVVLGNTTNSPSEVYWSEFNNSDAWTKGLNQCDSQTLQGGGWVQSIVGGEVGYVFQEHAITRMTYVGPPLIFQFDTIELNRGLAAPGAITTIGQTSYFYSHGGFCSFDPVNGVTLIGNNKVDNWFSDNIATNQLAFMTAGYDTSKKIVVFSFKSTLAGASVQNDTLLIFNRVSNEWSYAKINHDMVFSSLTQGVTLDGLNSLYTSIENIPYSLDSRVWTGGASILNAITSDHKLGSFSGSALAATMQTADTELSKGRRSLVTNVRPFTDASSATVQIFSREVFSEANNFNSQIRSLQPNGDCPVFDSARYHRVTLQIPAAATWTFATGLDLEGQDDGEIMARVSGGGGGP